MKKLLIPLLLLCGIIGEAQVFTPIHNAQAIDYLSAIKYFQIPYGDIPTLNGTTRLSPGALFYATSDSSIYSWTGTQWLKVTTGIGGGTGGIDSATFYNNVLCFWDEGGSTCFDLSNPVCFSQVSEDRRRQVFYNCNGDSLYQNEYPFTWVGVTDPLTRTANLAEDTVIFGVRKAWFDSLYGGGGTTYTASNGLSLVGSDFQLGGALTGSPNIDARNGNYSITIQGDAGNGFPLIYSTGGPQGIRGSGTVYGISAESAGLPLQVVGESVSASSVQRFINLTRSTLVGQNGIGASIDVDLQNDASSGTAASSLITKFTDVTAGSEDAQLEIQLKQAGGAMARKLAIASNGSLILDGYASSGFASSDTSANKPLTVDASGIVKQGFWAGSGGGGGGATIYSGNGSLASDRTVSLNGKLLEFTDASSNQFLYLNPVTSTSGISATDNTNLAILTLSGDASANFLIGASDGSNSATVVGNAVSQDISLSALTTTVNGAIINNADTSTSPFNIVTIDGNNQLRRAAYPAGSVSGVYEEIISTAAQTTFSFTSVPVSTDKYMVYVNGAAVPKTYYSVSTNDIIFSSGLVDGDSVILQGIQ